MFRSCVLFAILATMPMTAIVHAQLLPPKQPPAKTTPPIAPVGMQAPAGTPAKPSPFDEVDTNHDGFISRDEYLAMEKKRFAEFDTNHDGKIDAKEVATSPPLMERNQKAAERMIKQWDSNDDGIVSADEYRQAAEKRFAQQDKAGSGKIARPTATPPGMRAPGAQTMLKVEPKPAPPTPPSDQKH